jgi:hypothetical protein
VHCALKKLSKKSKFQNVAFLTLSPTALLPPSYPTALGPIGPNKKDIIGRKMSILMMSARSDQSQGRRLRALALADSPLSLPQGFQLLFFHLGCM